MSNILATARKSAIVRTSSAYRVRNVVICSTVSEVASGVVTRPFRAFFVSSIRPLARRVMPRGENVQHKIGLRGTRFPASYVVPASDPHSLDVRRTIRAGGRAS